MPPSHAAIRRLYDDRMYDRLVDEYYQGSGYLNFGYWEGTTPHAAQASENLMERLLSLVPRRCGSILDVACGIGATTQYLLKYFQPGNIVGINLSQKQLMTCRERLPRCPFVRMDAARLGFAAESFDHVICVEAAFHFRTREMFLREAYRVMKPGGNLVLSDALISRVQADRRRHWDENNYVADPQEYEALLRAIGFGEIRIQDATEACWRGCFWSVVRFAHERFLCGAIDLEQLDAFLDRLYRLAADLDYYILVGAIKSS